MKPTAPHHEGSRTPGRLRTALGRLRGVLAIAVATALLLGLAALGFVSDRRAASTAESVHRSDRLQQQSTLTGLARQYLMLTFGEVDTLARTPGWQLTPGAAGDRQRLADFIGASPLVSAGAAVVGLDGNPRTVATQPGVELPGPADPGYGPLRAALQAGRPGLSSLMPSAGRSLLAFALPIAPRGIPQAILVGYVDARSWPLQQYVNQTRIGTHAEGYVLDGDGRAVAAPRPDLIGSPVPGLPNGRVQGPAEMLRYQVGGKEFVTTRGALDLGGWESVNAQPATDYDGTFTRRHTETELALLALLVTIGSAAIAAVYARHRHLAAAAQEAMFDPLTGCAQRRLLSMRLEAALARAPRAGTHVALIYADLDGFKAVNDQHGHRRGDALLVEVARRLQGAVRAEDMVARLGGDEFVVVLEGMRDPGDVAVFTDRILAEVGRPIQLDRAVAHVGISLGAVLASSGTVEAVLESADTAMYDAKRAGQGPVIRQIGALALLPAGRPRLAARLDGAPETAG